MSLFTKLKEWASSGDKTERSDPEIAAGWREGEAPLYTEWNYQENARDVRINETSLAVEGLNTLAPTTTPGFLCGDQHNNLTQWSEPGAWPNIMSLGETIVSSCLGWNYETNKPTLYVIGSSGDVRTITGVWDRYNGPTAGWVLALSFPHARPTTGSKGLLSICCDGFALYVLWYRDSDNHIFVSKFLASGGTYSTSAAWTYDTTHVLVSSETDKYMIIVADTTRVAILLPEYPAANDVSIGILSKTGLVYAVGEGTGLGGALGVSGKRAKIVSSGTHIFWLATDAFAGTTSTYLASASIADPTTSSYALALIISLSTTDYWAQPKGILATWDVVIISTPAGGIINFPLHIGTGSHLVAQIDALNEYQTSDYGVALGTDGINLWHQTISYNAVYPSTFFTFSKIPLGMVGPMAVSSSWPTSYYANRIHSTLNDVETTNRPGDLIHDGRDLWWVGIDGTIARISNPGAR